MMIDNALEIIKPEPDSQYRLCPCRCRSDNMAYVKCQHPDGERWRVQCFDCGAIIDAGRPGPRHDAQLAWNKWAKEETCKTTIL